MLKRLALLGCALFIAGCQKNIQTTEAVRAGLLEHLEKVSGLNTKSMKIDLGNVSFRENEADVTVSFLPNGAAPGEGMQMAYTLERKGDKWVVKGKRGASGGAGGGMMPGHGTPAPSAAPSGAMPPGHPPVPGASPGAEEKKP